MLIQETFPNSSRDIHLWIKNGDQNERVVGFYDKSTDRWFRWDTIVLSGTVQKVFTMTFDVVAWSEIPTKKNCRDFVVHTVSPVLRNYV